MKDILHTPSKTDVGYECLTCGVELPSGVCVMAPKVLEVAGFFVPFDGTPGWVPCSSPAVDGIRQDVESVASIRVEAAELAPGETVKEAAPVSEFDRRMNSMSFQNWLALREATKPKVD